MKTVVENFLVEIDYDKNASKVLKFMVNTQLKRNSTRTAEIINVTKDLVSVYVC